MNNCKGERLLPTWSENLHIAGFQGDSSNLIGCLLTGTQLPLTTGTAWYFVGCDIIMIVQYIYYAASNASEARRSSQQRKRQLILNAAAVGEQHLLEYDIYNSDAQHGLTCESARVSQMHTVHSAPSACP